MCAPNLTASPDKLDGSITSAEETISSNSAMRPSMKPCRSRAAWYSAFSDRSPCVRASAMARMIAGRSTDLSWRSSSSSRCNPGAVIGNLGTWRSFDWLVVTQAPPARPGKRPAAATGSERSAKIGLKGGHFKRTRLQSGDRMNRGAGARHGRVVRHPVRQRAAADVEAVPHRLRAGGGVDDELHLARADRVHAMRAAFQHLV